MVISDNVARFVALSALVINRIHLATILINAVVVCIIALSRHRCDVTPSITLVGAATRAELSALAHEKAISRPSRRSPIITRIVICKMQAFRAKHGTASTSAKKLRTVADAQMDELLSFWAKGSQRSDSEKPWTKSCSEWF